ncbi:hypothetical protein [Sorangium sp. So ce1099]|uniref:hypothetical protein n=1 Tax=Sorangium sp. So ce1099 TaxID=3133331 RepID=UPI003F610180
MNRQDAKDAKRREKEKLNRQDAKDAKDAKGSERKNFIFSFSLLAFLASWRFFSSLSPDGSPLQ